MTQIYFIRHAEANNRHHDDATRPLTEKGKADCALVRDYLADKHISQLVSSPYRRAADTLRCFAERAHLPIALDEGFAERRVASGWVEDFSSYARRQWADFTYKLPGGESLAETQARAVAALGRLLAAFPGQSVAVGTHGTALCTILRYYDPSFGYADFQDMAKRTPWAVHFRFDGPVYVCHAAVDLFL